LQHAHILRFHCGVNMPSLRNSISCNEARRGVANAPSRKLSARLMQAQDDERRRIARELHDGTGQVLALLIMNLDRLGQETERTRPDLTKSASECSQLARQISRELRAISYLLHPPLLDELGLTSAVAWFVNGFKNLTEIDVVVDLAPDMGRLPHDVETAIFRIVQESLTNVHRHSGSRMAAISLQRQRGNVVLEVSDRGKGISGVRLSQIARGESSGIGLRGMRERVKSLGGEIDISAFDGGTHVRVAIPLPREERSTETRLAPGRYFHHKEDDMGTCDRP
jgi:two-component system, NarL family, sensor kinase